MAVQVYTFHITYEGLEEKIWRNVQLSSNYRLDQLGYLVLAAFDTLAYHLFEFEYQGERYELPDYETALDEQLDVAMFKLYQFKMNIGDHLKMIYDFGANQVFRLELLAMNPMPKGQGKHYPLIVDGAGRGILDDMSAYEVKKLIEQIDKNGQTDEPVYYHECSEPWDYRHFDLKCANALLKGAIALIEDAYAPFWDMLEQ